MTVYHQERDITLHLGHALEILPTLPAESVNCIVTSPPYYGLRDYGLPPTSWPAVEYAPMPGMAPITVPAMDACLGLEPDPAAYVGHLLLMLTEVRRVLRRDGVLWLNLGDSYAGKANGGESYDRHRGHGHRSKEGIIPRRINNTSAAPYKSLLGIPWRAAFALIADGWRLRNEVIWNKLNAMPESVKDRLTGRHEQLFLFSRSDRYWFDLDAIRQPVAEVSLQRAQPHRTPPGRAAREGTPYEGIAAPQTLRLDQLNHPQGRNPGDVWTISTQPFPGAHFATMPPALAARCILAGCPDDGTVLDTSVGSGTTLMVARRAGRRGIGIDPKAEYLALAIDRIGQDTFEVPQPTEQPTPASLQLDLIEEATA